MIHAKNDKIVTQFVKVMPRILWPLFFLDTVYIHYSGARFAQEMKIKCRSKVRKN